MANQAQVLKLSKGKQAKLIDELGLLKAQISDLQDQYDNKVAVFKEFGQEGVFEGFLFKLSVSIVNSVKLDTKKVKSFLTPQQIIDSSVTSTSVRALLSTK